MNDTIRIEEIVEQYSDGTEYTIYLVWNATVQGQWERRPFVSFVK